MISNLNFLLKQKTLKFSSALYNPSEVVIDVENPYSEGGEFKIMILEANNKFGIIRNPFGTNQTDDISSDSTSSFASSQQAAKPKNSDSTRSTKKTKFL